LSVKIEWFEKRQAIGDSNNCGKIFFMIG